MLSEGRVIMTRQHAFLLLAISGFLPSCATAAAADGEKRWYRGNTHTHTINSDGDSTPDEVVRWYREHGYQFLVLSDHNFLTNAEGLNSVHAATGKFLVIPGEEVTDRFGEEPIHVNGLAVEAFVEPQGGENVRDVLQRNVDAIRAVSGVPHINHPNFGWAISAEDLKAVENYRLFEIFNGHPLVNNAGGGGTPGLEEMWDMILSSGRLVYGIAVDDAHHFKRPWDRHASQPGRGWIVVRASELSSDAILEAMENGDFYASTGVEISELLTDEREVRIAMQTRSDEKFITTFIGAGGGVLACVETNPARYEIRGDEQYVRAKIADSNGNFAWVQPVMLRTAAEMEP